MAWLCVQHGGACEAVVRTPGGLRHMGLGFASPCHRSEWSSLESQAISIHRTLEANEMSLHGLPHRDLEVLLLQLARLQADAQVEPNQPKGRAPLLRLA